MLKDVNLVIWMETSPVQLAMQQHEAEKPCPTICADFSRITR
jgi:hypothetical protein